MANALVQSRLHAIMNILREAHLGGGPVSSATKGNERESFVNLVLRNVISPPYRIGTGDITDLAGNATGQVDLVIEYPGSLSFPLLQGNDARLYLAESVCAVIEVKSNLSTQWEQVEQKAKQIAQLNRDLSQVLKLSRNRRYAFDNLDATRKVPFFVVGYDSWVSSDEIEKRFAESNKVGATISGILEINAQRYRGRPKEFSDHSLVGPFSVYGFLVSLEQLTSSMSQAKPPFLPYAR